MTILIIAVLSLLGTILLPPTTVFQAYSKRVILAVDQLINALAGGHEDHTLSGRAGYGRMQGSPMWTAVANFIDRLFKDPNHCRHAIEHELVKSVRYKDYKRMTPIQRALAATLFIIAIAGIRWWLFTLEIVQGIYQ